MKSETYQKEGWFILEEENQVFGVEAENKDDFNSEEKFNIYHKDKEDAEKNIQASAKELNDFFDSLIKDEPDPTEEEVNEGIRKILERAYPEKKTNKSKKVALKVLFIAALLSVLSFSCLFAIGNSHNISIENGFLTFAKDTVKVVFFGEKKEEYIDVKTLLEDLRFHGYENVLIPQSLYHCKSSVPEYCMGTGAEGFNDCVTFELYNDDLSYSFKIEQIELGVELGDYYLGVDSAETLIVDDMHLYVFEFDSGFSSIRFVNDGYECIIHAEMSLSEMINTAKTISKMEE